MPAGMSKTMAFPSVARLVLSAVFAAPLTGQAAGQQKLYILNSGGEDVSVVDVATQKVVRTINVGAGPHGIATTKRQDVLYVATEGDRTLSVIDTVRDEVMARYPILGGRPNEIEVTSDGRWVYVAALADGVYEVFDTAERKIVARIPTDGYPHNVVVSPDDRFMYLSPYNRGDDSAEDAAAEGLPTSLNRKIYIVETATHSVVGTIPLGDAPRPLTLSGDGTKLYVNTDHLLGFVVIDVPGRAVLHRVRYDLTKKEQSKPRRSHGIGLSPDQREVWSTDTKHRVVHVFDATREPPVQTARVPTGKKPYWVTFTPDGKTVYVANAGDDTVSVIDAGAKRERTRIAVGKDKVPKRILVVTPPSPVPERESDGAPAGDTGSEPAPRR